MAERAPHLLIIEARFYDEIADELLRGAEAVLKRAGATFDRVSVPGSLELPAALSMALAVADEGGTKHDGYVVLGCVVRGETSHYDIVANQSARAIIDLAAGEGLALGFGVLTVETMDQARVRARVEEVNKGGAAAQAALHMIALKARLAS